MYWPSLIDKRLANRTSTLLVSWPTVKLNNRVDICPSNWLTSPLADWPTDERIDLLTTWLSDWLIDWLTDWLTDLLTYWLNSDWLLDWLTDWRTTYWLTDWLTDSLTDWLIASRPIKQPCPTNWPSDSWLYNSLTCSLTDNVKQSDWPSDRKTDQLTHYNSFLKTTAAVNVEVGNRLTTPCLTLR